MKKIMGFVIVALIAAILLLSIDVRTDSETEPSLHAMSADPWTGAVLLDLDDDADEEDRDQVADRIRATIAPIDANSGDEVLGTLLSEEDQLYRLHAPDGMTSEILAALRGHEDVEGIERERIWTLGPEEMARVSLDDRADALDDPDVFRPNDPYYKHQWHLDQIQMPRAWTRTRGKGAVVAVIDTGVAFEDFRGYKRVPDLTEGHFVPGFDFVDKDPHANDEHGHGTHVAGTIAQATNNGLGVAGVAPEARIMPLRVLDRRGRGSWGAIAAAIRWAADHDADVINMSLGGGMPSQTVRRAIDYAHNKGVVVVAAAGNSSRARVEYPAAHRHVISVGAVRFDEQLTFYSCYGKGLDIVAPGGDLRVDQNGDGLPDGVLQNTILPGRPAQNDYLAYQGTSMAAPHVAGVAALLVASGIDDPDRVEEILKQSAKSKNDRRRYASGLVQADSALALAKGTTGGLRGLLAAGLTLFVLLGLRRRNQLGVSTIGSVGVAAAVGGALTFVPFHLIPVAGGALATLFSGAPGELARAVGFLGPVALSALVPFAMAALFLGWRRAVPVIVGTSIAFAVWLGLEAVMPSMHVELLPAWAVGPWLLINAAIAFGIGALAARKSQTAGE
ncbi:MAG: S8 family serine peptidase [Myxococcota bacterium]